MAVSSPTPRTATGRSALEAARTLAEEAGTRALERFREPQEVTVKGRGNLLTETDLAIEGHFQKNLSALFPEHRVLSEETASRTELNGWVWVIDPLDGTRNFVSGIPFFCVNVALCHDGDPLMAVTHDPNHGETFWTEKGCGAWLNERPIRASDKTSVAASVLGIDLGYDDPRGSAALQLIHLLFPGVQSVRIPGSAALGLAYAACGRYDLFVHHDLYSWDVAAGLLLVQEAGGTITDRHGRPITLRSRSVIAGGNGAHADFLRWQREHEQQLDPVPD